MRILGKGSRARMSCSIFLGHFMLVKFSWSRDTLPVEIKMVLFAIQLIGRPFESVVGSLVASIGTRAALRVVLTCESLSVLGE